MEDIIKRYKYIRVNIRLLFLCSTKCLYIYIRRYKCDHKVCGIYEESYSKYANQKVSKYAINTHNGEHPTVVGVSVCALVYQMLIETCIRRNQNTQRTCLTYVRNYLMPPHSTFKITNS